MKSQFSAVFLFFTTRVDKCFSIVPDTERFSSSIVASDAELLSGRLSRPQHSRDEITRSYIDRDPIYFDDEFGSADNEDNLDILHHDPLS
eukprot:scaffold2091_cov66-Skeletonema_marinoi.AAC.2